jgi:putative DNA-invertase from lambdoid prophage Rac
MTSITFAYARVSTDDQTCENQRRTITAKYPNVRWYQDDGVSGSIPASQRPQMSKLLEAVQEGDSLVVSAIDRLGRNTLDVMHTVETLKAKGVSVVSMREGFDLATPTGNFMLTMLAAMAQLERENIKIRQLAGLERARAEGKNLGREKTIDDNAVAQWREDNQASIKATAEHFDISIASVKRACSTSKVKA